MDLTLSHPVPFCPYPVKITAVNNLDHAVNWKRHPNNFGIELVEEKPPHPIPRYPLHVARSNGLDISRGGYTTSSIYIKKVPSGGKKAPGIYSVTRGRRP